jgi:hypothetical protein
MGNVYRYGRYLDSEQSIGLSTASQDSVFKAKKTTPKQLKFNLYCDRRPVRLGAMPLVERVTFF